MKSSSSIRGVIVIVTVVTSLMVIAAHRAIGHKSTKQPSTSVWKLRPGERLIYDLEYECDSYSDLRGMYSTVDPGVDKNAAAVSPHVYRVSVNSRVVLTAIEQTDNSIVVSYRFPTARVDAESEMGSLLDNERVQFELARDTFCAIDVQGRIRALMPHPDN